MQNTTFGCGVARLVSLIVPNNSVRADVSRGYSCRVKQLLDDERGGGLALRARDADDPQML